MYNKKQKLGRLDCVVVSSFCSALEFLKSNQREEGLIVNGPIELSRKEKEALRTIPTFFSMKDVQLLKFQSIVTNSSLLSEAVAAGLRNESVVCLWFEGCKASMPGMKSISQAILERSTPFQLQLHQNSHELTREFLEVSYLKCCSLKVSSVSCAGLDKPVKKLFSRGSICSLSLNSVQGLTKSTFLQLGRCVFFFLGLKKLDLSCTFAPVSALKRLYSSLNSIAKANPSNTLEVLHLGDTEMDEPLAYCYTTLLRSEHLKLLSFAQEIKLNQT